MPGQMPSFPPLPLFTPIEAVGRHAELWGYQLVEKFYGHARTERSRVPLINHIREGVWLMNHLGAEIAAIEAFCIHPLLQADNDLPRHLPSLLKALNNPSGPGFCSPGVLAYAMEYRNIANAGLLTGFLQRGYVQTSPLPQVNDMLVADKVQNYKDFIQFHKATHAKSKELTDYFECWLRTLNVNSMMCRSFDDLAEKLHGLYR